MGEEGKEEEHNNGMLMREFAERNDLVIVNTWKEGGSEWTWISKDKRTRIDYIMMSMNMWEGEGGTIKRGEVERQQINYGLDWKFVDHIPVGCGAKWPTYDIHIQRKREVNTRKMLTDIRKKGRRRQIRFIYKCQTKWKQREEERNDMLIQSQIGEMDNMAEEIIEESAKEVWPVEGKLKPGKKTETKEKALEKWMIFISIREEWETQDEKERKEEENRKWRGRMSNPDNEEMEQIRSRARELKKNKAWKCKEYQCKEICEVLIGRKNKEEEQKMLRRIIKVWKPRAEFIKWDKQVSKEKKEEKEKERKQEKE